MPNTSSSTPVYYPKDGLKSDIHPARLYIKKTGFPKYVMVSGGVSKLGKTPLLFVESGTKINSEHYQELLNQMLPACRVLANEQPFIFKKKGPVHIHQHQLWPTLRNMQTTASCFHHPNGLQSLRTSTRVTIASGTN